MGLLGSLAGGYADLVLYNLEVAGSVLTLNNHVEIFTDGVEKFKDLKEELKTPNVISISSITLLRTMNYLIP